VLAPSYIDNLKQIDRKALQAFISACATKMPTLDDWGRLAAKTPPAYSVPLLFPYLQVFTSEFGGMDQTWLCYQFFGALSDGQKKVARTGGDLLYGDLSPTAREILATLAFQVSHPIIGNKSGVAAMSGFATGPSQEPTDLLPFGILSTQPITFSIRKSYAVLQVTKTPNDYMTYPQPMSALAYNATVDPKVFINGIRPVLDRFRIGNLMRIQFTTPLTGDQFLAGYLYEYDIDRNSKVYDLGSAPKEFKDAYDKAIKERGG
jgi:hypothetical protein